MGRKEKERKRTMEKELEYKRDPRRDRIRALLKLCPKERVCKIEKVKMGEVVYPRFPRKKSFPRAA